MEAALVARDVVGVQDFVLLEDFNNIDAFIDNLRKRFRENLIYVRITVHEFHIFASSESNKILL